MIKRFVVIAASIAAMMATAAGTASADKHPGHDHHGHGLVGDITFIVPITVLLNDNVVAVLGLAEDE